jgi:putative colanic acid biosynthesis glycosyltransferase WcaI
MKLLIISQAFWPDTVSVSQHMTDLALELKKNGHHIDVFSSRHGYEDSKVDFPAAESLDGIRIQRINNTAFGKKKVLGRLADFFSFNVLLYIKLRRIKKGAYDGAICTTSPPLVGYITIRALRARKIPFCYWAMDLQPELSIVSGLIGKDSLSARTLTHMANYVMRRSDLTITLDTYMQEHFGSRGALPDRIRTVPVWPVMDKVYEGTRLANPFRLENNFGDKIVVMYSGNHSYVHPLDTLLKAALALRRNDNFVFVFIGGGVRKKDVTEFKDKHRLDNIVQLPYQPRSNIHNSLGAADIHVVIMGDGQVGFTHPNKIYGAMFIGRAVLYIGPTPSHVTDIIDGLPGNIAVLHGDDAALVDRLLGFQGLTEEKRTEIGRINREYARQNFAPEVLKEKMVRILEKEL